MTDSISSLEAYGIAVLQGMTELFPVSSLGHAVVLPPLLKLSIDQEASTFLPFIVVLHLGTALALLLYFWRDWLNFGFAVLGQGRNVKQERHVFGLVCVATVPAALIGVTLEHIIRGFFGSPVLAGAFLIVNGFILFLGERIKHAGRKSLSEVGWVTAFVIGACQALALIPGISRSGATMVGGLLAGLKHEQAARFSFLLATPIIAGAGVLEVPKLLKEWGAFDPVTVLLAGVLAGVTAFASVAVLMHYFKKHEIEALDPFAWYCWALGGVTLIILL